MSNATGADRSNGGTNAGEKSESLRGWAAIVVSTLLVCSTAVLFASGHAYRLGYVYELGFDLAQLPEGFYETLFWGFSGGAPLVFAWAVGVVIASAGCGLLVWLGDVLWERAAGRWRLLRRLPVPSARPERKAGTHVKLILGAFLLLPVIYLFAMAYIGMAEFQKLGTKKGRELIEALRTDAATASAKYGIQKIELWFSLPPDAVVRGYRLLCTESLCSIYDPDPKVRAVRLISLENLREIRVVDRR